MIEDIQHIQTLLRAFISSKLNAGDVALDATAGWGRDTLFLASLVGAEGKVYAFDIQSQAIEETRRLLKEHQLEDRVILHCCDHANLNGIIKDRFKIAVFNLGYLPSSDHTVITKPKSTLPAIQGALNLLSKSGLLILTVYRGHEGAIEEANEVEKFLRSLSKKDFSVLTGCYINQGDKSPYWVIVQKNRED